MSAAEELAQRRREKILARSQLEGETSKEQAEQQTSKGTSVFERYKNLKDRHKLQQKLMETSKGVGLIIVILAYALPAEAVYSAVVIIMAAFALKISGQSDSRKGGDEFNWLGKLGGIVGKFQHVERVFFVLRVVVNVTFSYLMAAVLVEEVLRRGENLFGEL